MPCPSIKLGTGSHVHVYLSSISHGLRRYSELMEVKMMLYNVLDGEVSVFKYQAEPRRGGKESCPHLKKCEDIARFIAVVIIDHIDKEISLLNMS
jgi:hypothetical protein